MLLASTQLLILTILQDALLNEVDSGTELDSQAEDEVEEIGKIEEEEPEKGDEDKKDDQPVNVVNILKS